VLFSSWRTERLEGLEAKSKVTMDESQEKLALFEPTYFCDYLVTTTLFWEPVPVVPMETGMNTDEPVIPVLYRFRRYFDKYRFTGTEYRLNWASPTGPVLAG
jgi:hypothetical protein